MEPIGFAFSLTQQEILYCTSEDNSCQAANLFCLLSSYFLLICFLLFHCGCAHCCHTAGEEKWGFFGTHVGRSINCTDLFKENWGLISDFHNECWLAAEPSSLYPRVNLPTNLIPKDFIGALKILKYVYRKGICFENKKTPNLYIPLKNSDQRRSDVLVDN